MSATAIVLNWKRPNNLKLILENLKDHPYIHEIIVWNNNSESPVVTEKAKVIQGNQDNIFNMNCRWYAAMMASYPFVYMQDDDRLVSHELISEMYEAMIVDPNRQYGLDPRRLTNGQYDGNIHFQSDPHKLEGPAEEAETILTGTTMFHTKCLPYVLHCLNRMENKNGIRDGEDLFFSCALQKFFGQKPILMSKRIKGKHWYNLEQNDAIRDRPGRNRAALLDYWFKYNFPEPESMIHE